MNDPRVGRGFYPTFNANYPLLQWPLDHLFVSPHFELVGIDRLPGIGSDHFPVFATLRYEPKAEVHQEAPQADVEDHKEARQRIAEGR